MSRTKKLIYTSACIALGIILPLAFHAIPNAGSIFLPMHIPVLLCGLICGPWCGLACGVLAPLLSSVITGMPPAARLPSMLCELAVYGLCAGILIAVIKTKSRAANLYISLVGAMLLGRAVLGVVNALIFQVGKYSFKVWLTASFVTSLPGIAAQVIVIPILILALERARLIPRAEQEQSNG